MSNTFTTGKTFQTGEQVTAADLNNAVNQAVPLTAVTDDLTLNVVNNKLQLKDGDGTNGVPFTKFKHLDARTILCNATNSAAAPNDLVLGTDQIIKCNDTGTGLLAGKISTNNINSDAVTIAKTDFIGDSTATMTLSGTAPRIILDDTGNSGSSPEINGNSQDGNLSILAEKTGADITIDADDEVILKHNGTDGLTVAADVAKDQGGNDAAGAKVTGGLYVTGDVYVDDQVIADHLRLIGDEPNIVFDQDDFGSPNSFITGNSSVNTIETRVLKAYSDIISTAVDNITLKTTNNEAADFDSGSNQYHERFRVAHDAGKDSSGTLSAGAKVSGDLQVTGGIHLTNASKIPTIQDNVTIQGSAPIITFNDSDNSGASPTIGGDSDFGNLSLNASKNGAEVNIYSGGSLRFQVGQDVSKDADNSASAGIRSKNDIYAEGDISADGDVVASLASDKRLKDNIFPIQDATSKVNKLSGNTFIWNDKSKYSGSDVGVIAQEVQEIIPSAVKETEKGYLKVEYTKIVPLLIESIKELSAKVQELEAKVK